MQWGKADNENTAKQKADQAECEEMWTSSFKNQRQRWCKPGKSYSLHSGSLKNSVQNQNKTNKRLTISVRRKILEKFIWKNQKTVVVSCPRAAGNRQAVGSNLGWQRRDRSRNLIQGTQVSDTEFQAPPGSVLQESFWRQGLQADGWAGIPAPGFLWMRSCSHVAKLGTSAPQKSGKTRQK